MAKEEFLEKQNLAKVPITTVLKDYDSIICSESDAIKRIMLSKLYKNSIKADGGILIKDPINADSLEDGWYYKLQFKEDTEKYNFPYQYGVIFVKKIHPTTDHDSIIQIHFSPATKSITVRMKWRGAWENKKISFK